MTIEEAKKKLLSIAKNEVGYLEKETIESLDDKTRNAGYNNYTKYARDLFPHLQGYAWCCMFVYWCFHQCLGKIMTRNLIGQLTAKCSTLKDGMDISKNPQVGDIVFFQKDGEINHNGIVYKVDMQNIYTIEGNTSVGNNVVIPNGGGVFEKVYSKTNPRIACYGRPKWNLLEHETAINAVISATNVNIREGAGTNYKIIGNETKGFEFIIKNEKYDNLGYRWLNFNYKGYDGWIRSDFTRIG